MDTRDFQDENIENLPPPRTADGGEGVEKFQFRTPTKEMNRERDKFHSSNVSLSIAYSNLSARTFSHKKPSSYPANSMVQTFRRSLSFITDHTPVRKLLRSSKASKGSTLSMNSSCSIESPSYVLNDESVSVKLHDFRQGIQPREIFQSMMDIRTCLSPVKNHTEVSPTQAKIRTSFLTELDPNQSLNTTTNNNRFSIDKALFDSSKEVQSTKRYNCFLELLHTEENFVGILTTIVDVFQKPLQQNSILKPNEVQGIFGNIAALQAVHQRILAGLMALYLNWHEQCLIGSVFVEQSFDLFKVYPKYVRNYAQMVRTLQNCDKKTTRFRAFLKANQKKEACARQGLKELLIRPVQRLPSVRLLLQTVKAHTGQHNPDQACLGQACDRLNDIISQANEGKVCVK